MTDKTKPPRRSSGEKPPRRMSGTYEWADTTLNIQMGCEHDCLYCYARFNAVERFGYCKSLEAWRHPVINQAKVNAKRTKKFGTVMYPSTHDITSLNINECVCVIRKLLDAGNKVLIVSKPHIDCIRQICGQFEGYKDRILFRFTIGSMNDEVLKFWEPGAPGFGERLQCLTVAFERGFNTSVSCEPYLDERINLTYMACAPWLTESFWVGMLRRFDSRVKLDGVTEEQMRQFVMPLKTLQKEQWVRAIYKTLDGREFVKWKDSVREVICPA